MSSLKRSIVIRNIDLCDKWIDILKQGKFTTLGLHFITTKNTVEDYIDWLNNGGREMIKKVEDAGIEVEHELHALRYLLPRNLFDEHPEYFRVNTNGKRSGDHNLCVQSEEALSIISERAYGLAKEFRQSGHRYYLWTDDAIDAWCHCEKCKDISPSDQNLRIVKSILKGLRRYDPEAELSYLAYHNTVTPPTEPITEGIFVEYAPIHRDMFTPVTEGENQTHAENIEKLLEVFDPKNAEILEYWLDVSFYTKWGRLPLIKVPYHENVLSADFDFYSSLGVRAIKTFGAFMNESYLEEYGDKEIIDYGTLLSQK
ncbi:MAG: DUF4838 domain-containing protein [Ruminococcaceae bacterium]|nr:DUF4838 domain-containing protein [Oscillospiraceae bacterium]